MIQFRLWYDIYVQIDSTNDLSNFRPKLSDSQIIHTFMFHSHSFVEFYKFIFSILNVCEFYVSLFLSGGNFGRHAKSAHKDTHTHTPTSQHETHSRNVYLLLNGKQDSKQVFHLPLPWSSTHTSFTLFTIRNQYSGRICLN